MRRLWPFARSRPKEAARPAPRALDPRHLPDDLPPEVAAYFRGPIDGREDWFERFLAEPELDNLRTFRSVGDLTPEQADQVRDVVATGQPRQARFNLLLNPRLLPDDVRLGTLRRGLTDLDPYMRIAAATGLQDPRETPIGPEDWPAVRDELIACLDDPQPAIRNRASVTLAGRAGPGDGPALEAVEAHDAEVSNLLIACARAGANDAAMTLLPRLLAREQLHPAARGYLERWQATGRLPKEDPPPFLMVPGLGYIPNLDGG